MRAAAKRHILDSIIDPKQPWRDGRPYFAFPPYKCVMTTGEWKAILARAQQGEAEAEVRVAEIYDDGCRDKRGQILIRRSDRKAAEWYQRAAEHGDLIAQISLSNMLDDGRAGKKDRGEAIRWLKRAFRGGDTTGAANNLAIIYRLDGDLQRAVFWFKKHQPRDGGIALQLGIHYYWGKEVRTNHAKAVRLFRKATRSREIIDISEYERDNAFFYLAIAYVEGKGVKKSLATAQKLLERANKDNDHPPAARLLRRINKESR